MHVYNTFQWCIGSLSKPTSLKKTDSPFPSSHQLPIPPHQGWGFTLDPYVMFFCEHLISWEHSLFLVNKFERVKRNTQFIWYRKKTYLHSGPDSTEEKMEVCSTSANPMSKGMTIKKRWQFGNYNARNQKICELCVQFTLMSFVLV